MRAALCGPGLCCQCGSVGMALLWHGRMDADTNLTLLSDIYALVSFIYLFLSLTFLPSQELARVACPFGSGHWRVSGKDIFGYGGSHKKLTLARGLRTCPSWCCCCALLSFPCQQNGETQRVGSGARNSVYSYEIADT